MPNNAVLIVAGDADPAEARRLAEKNFGPVPAGTPPKRLRLEEPEHRAPIRVEMKHPRVPQPSWRRYYVAPSYMTGATQHAYALQVLSEILGGGVGSRLYQALVLKDGIALSVNADYSPTALGMTTFALSATPKPGSSVADLEKAIDRELHRVVEQEVDPDEVRRAALRMQAAAIYARDSLSGPANIVGAALVTGRTLADVDAWPDRIGAVTPADIQAAARAVLVERNSATGILLPERTS
jgi:zinc protease